MKLLPMIARHFDESNINPDNDCFIIGTQNAVNFIDKFAISQTYLIHYCNMFDNSEFGCIDNNTDLEKLINVAHYHYIKNEV